MSEMSLNKALKFYITLPQPCPYLSHRSEQKLFTTLDSQTSEFMHDHLICSGFRRSQTVLYKPVCQNCQACKPARICVNKFHLTKRFNRIVNKNKRLKITCQRPLANYEQYDLFKRYLADRHKGGSMEKMTFADYKVMLEETVAKTLLYEYREHGRLVAVCLTDHIRDGLSMNYSFFDPEFQHRGLGNFMILHHIKLAQKLEKRYIYLGYWISDSSKMSYKSAFRPLEVFQAQIWVCSDTLNTVKQ